MKNLFRFILLFATMIVSCSKDETASTTLYTISITAGTGGTVSASGGTYEAGSKVSVTAIPNGEFIFSGWSNGVLENPLNITITSNENITANFTKKKYPLTVNIVGEGIVTEEIVSTGKTTDYDSGTVVKLLASPSDGWEFVQWSGDYSGSDNPTELTINAPIELNAIFEPICTLEQMDQPNYKIPSYELDFIYHHPGINELLSSIDPNHGDHITNYGTNSISVDYNNDGYLDYISYYSDYTVQDDRNYIKFFVSDCNGSLTLDEQNQNKFLGPTWGRKLIIGDYNSDSYLDLCLIGTGWDYPPFPGEYPIILLGGENGLFTEKRLMEYVGVFHSGASGDIDNDGDLDIILTSGPNNSPVLINDGNANFTLTDEILKIENRSSSRYTTEIYDINNDGFLDIITAGGERLDWQLSDGVIDSPPIIYYGPNYNENYIILPRTGQDLSTLTLDVGFYDMNGDGHEEIFIYRTNGEYSNWHIQVLTLENGIFVDKSSEFIDVNFVENKYPHSWMYIGDFDKDGTVELISEWDPEIDWKYDSYEEWELINNKFIKVN